MHDRRRTNLRFILRVEAHHARISKLETRNVFTIDYYLHFFHDRRSNFLPWISVAKFRTSFRTRYGAWMLVKGKFTWHTASCVAPCTYTHTYIYTHQRIYRTPVIFQEDKSLVRREIFSRTFLTLSPFFFFKLTVSLINQLCCR